MLYFTLGSFETLHCNVAVWPSKTRVSTGGAIICVLTVNTEGNDIILFNNGKLKYKALLYFLRSYVLFM